MWVFCKRVPLACTCKNFASPKPLRALRPSMHECCKYFLRWYQLQTFTIFLRWYHAIFSLLIFELSLCVRCLWNQLPMSGAMTWEHYWCTTDPKRVMCQQQWAVVWQLVCTAKQYIAVSIASAAPKHTSKTTTFCPWMKVEKFIRIIALL